MEEDLTLKPIKEKTWRLDKNTALKKSLDSYRIVNPIRNEDRTINWKNFLIGGSWSRIFSVAFIVFVMIYLSWGYDQDMKTCFEIIENPKNICGIQSNYLIEENYSYLKDLDLSNISNNNELNLSVPS